MCAKRAADHSFRMPIQSSAGRATANVFVAIIVKLLLQTDAVFVRLVTATAAHCTAYWAHVEADSFLVHVLLC